MNTPTRNVVITGCSSGIGLETARYLRPLSWVVIPTARKPEDLAALTRDGFDPIPLDIADPDSTARAAERIEERTGGHLYGLVNNAGFGQVGAVEDLSRELLRYQFEVNVIGMQDLTNRLIPLMRRHQRGRIVNISSVLGRISLPFLGAYSASKFAMEALTDAMRVELKNAGIRVSLVEPGPITTAFRDSSARRAKETIDPDRAVHMAYYQTEIQRREANHFPPAKFTLGPDAVARKIRHALESRYPRTRYKVTVPAYAGALLARFAPDALLDLIMARQARAQEE